MFKFVILFVNLQDWIFNLLRQMAFVSLWNADRYLVIIPTYISNKNIFVMLLCLCHTVLHIQMERILWSRKCNTSFRILFFLHIIDSLFTFPSYRKHLYTTHIYCCIISPCVHIPPSRIMELIFTANFQY